MTVDAETGIAATEEAAARAAMATGIAATGTIILAGVTFGEHAVVTATDWLPFDRFAVAVAAAVALSYGPIRSWFVETFVGAVDDIGVRALGEPETFDQIDSVGTDYRLLYYLFFGAVLHVVSLSAQGRAATVAATCGSSRRFLVPDCPLLSVSVVALDATRALAWVASGLLVACALLAVFGWTLGRASATDAVSSDQPLDLPWSVFVGLLPSVVTVSRLADAGEDDAGEDGTGEDGTGEDGAGERDDSHATGDPDDEAPSEPATAPSDRRRAVAFLRWGGLAAVATVAAMACLVALLTRLASLSAVSWPLAHVFSFCLLTVAAATAGTIRSRVDGTRLRETTVTLGGRLVRGCRRSPAAGVAVSAATVVAALASLSVAVDALPAHRRPVADLLAGNPFLPMPLGYWGTVHHFTVVGGLASVLASAVDTRRWVRNSTLTTVADGVHRAGRTAVARGRRLWYWVFEHSPDSASRWFPWVRIATLGHLLFGGLALNEAVFGDPFGVLLAPVPAAAVVGGVAAWRDCRAHRDTLDRRAYARVCAVAFVPFFGGIWYLVSEYERSASDTSV